MSWAKLDDQFFAHPKIINLSKDAKLLQLAAITYCAGQLTDGLVTPGAVRMICAQVDVEAATVQELLAARVWDADGKNYRIHDYLVYNPSGEQVRSERAKTAQRVATWRQHQTTKSNAVTNASPVPVPVPHSSSVNVSSITRESGATSTSEPLTRTRTPSLAKNAAAKKPANRPAEPKPHPINPLWDVLEEVFYTPKTKPERDLFGMTVRDLKAVDATPDDVRARVRQHAKTQSHWDLTPRALVTHWSELGALCTGSNGYGTTESTRRAALERENALEEERARQHAEMVRELAQRSTGG